MFSYKIHRSVIVLVLCLFISLMKINIVYAQGQTKYFLSTAKKEIIFSSGKWKDIAADALKNSKYIFVDAYTSWCGPCQQLKDVTFKSKDAADFFNRNFINYTLDMEKGEGVELSDVWNVFSYPTLLFFNPEGKMVMKQTGYVDEKQLITIGKEALMRK